MSDQKICANYVFSGCKRPVLIRNEEINPNGLCKACLHVIFQREQEAIEVKEGNNLLTEEVERIVEENDELRRFRRDSLQSFQNLQETQNNQIEKYEKLVKDLEESNHDLYQENKCNISKIHDIEQKMEEYIKLLLEKQQKIDLLMQQLESKNRLPSTPKESLNEFKKITEEKSANNTPVSSPRRVSSVNSPREGNKSSLKKRESLVGRNSSVGSKKTKSRMTESTRVVKGKTVSKS